MARQAAKDRVLGIRSSLGLFSMALLRRQKVTITLLVLYWLTFFILAHVPIPGLVRKVGVSDKGLHFLAYLILVFLFWFSISPEKKVNWGRAAVWWVFFLVIGYGAVDEVVQGWVGRSCDVMDIAANIAGTLVGLILFSIVTFWPAALFVAGIVIFGLTNIAKTNPAELVPITNAMFYLFSYAIFSALWIRYLRLFLLLKPPKFQWLVMALAGPIVLLLIVKFSSMILGKDFALREVIISIAAVTAVVAVTSMIALFHRIKDPADKTQV